jgi:hypothetical protein
MCFTAVAQNGFLSVKKRNKQVMYYGKDSRFTFQTSDGEWITGFIEKIEKDSFTFSQQVIRYYTIGTDTLNFTGLRFALTDIIALPPRHQHFMWLRNGLLFQLLGGGNAGLNIINDLYRSDPPFARRNLPGLGISAAIFLVGTFMHADFDPSIRPGRKYKLELIPF